MNTIDAVDALGAPRNVVLYTCCTPEYSTLRNVQCHSARSEVKSLLQRGSCVHTVRLRHMNRSRGLAVHLRKMYPTAMNARVIAARKPMFWPMVNLPRL